MVKKQSSALQICIIANTAGNPSVTVYCVCYIYVTNVQTVQQMGLPTNTHTPAAMEDLVRGSVQGRNIGENRRGLFVAPILLVSPRYGGQVGSVRIAHVSM